MIEFIAFITFVVAVYAVYYDLTADKRISRLKNQINQERLQERKQENLEYVLVEMGLYESYGFIRTRNKLQWK